MKNTRIIAIILVAMLTIGSGAALAATAGTVSDPLISKSFAGDAYKNYFMAKATNALDAAMNNLLSRLSNRVGTIGTADSYSLKLGSSVDMTLGDSVLLTSGSAYINIKSGTVINVTTGQTVSSGSTLVKNNRYLAAENTSATVTVLSDAAVFAEGGYITEVTSVISFSDATKSHWAYKYVNAMAAMGIVNGVGNNKFSPGSNITRGDFVTMLGRLHGINAAEYISSIFTDVSSAKYYGPYIKWAQENGIVDGVGNDKFDPSAKITREQMAVIIVRYAEYAGITLADSGSTEKFADNSKISSWARTQVYAARNAGIINGLPGNVFSPKGNATRAECCAVLSRLVGLA